MAIPASEPNWDQILTDALTRQLVTHIMRALCKEQRRLLVMIDIHECPLRALETIMGLDHTTVGRRHKSAVDKFKRIAEKERLVERVLGAE
jgi:DNA-directed RNA polymerase specialized sigma24 family protein